MQTMLALAGLEHFWWRVSIGTILTLIVIQFIESKERKNGRNRHPKANSRHSRPVTVAPRVPGVTTSTLRARSNGARPGLERFLPHEESDMPILAHRVAKLDLNGSSQPFLSLNQNIPFGVEEFASCAGMHTVQIFGSIHDPNDVPHISCTCGFYALPVDIPPYDEASFYVTLMVELYGHVIEHESGYRAEYPSRGQQSS